MAESPSGWVLASLPDTEVLLLVETPNLGHSRLFLRCEKPLVSPTLSETCVGSCLYSIHSDDLGVCIQMHLTRENKETDVCADVNYYCILEYWHIAPLFNPILLNMGACF